LAVAAAEEDDDAAVDLAVVPLAFVVVAVDPEPEPAVVVAALPATLTLERVAGGSAVLAWVSY
jgi:hypothetical protein